jgi:superfamily II DNA or RNA helicase
MSDWQLAYAPRDWQVHALETWLRSRRGIVEVVTGGGKTVFAFQAMLALSDCLETLLVGVPLRAVI